MTVAELIDLLHSYDASLKVYVADDMGDTAGMQISSVRGITAGKPMEQEQVVLIEFSEEDTIELGD